MAISLKDGILTPHAGHEFFVCSDYSILKLTCLVCGRPEVWSARPASREGHLLSEHHDHRLGCAGSRVVCAEDGAVIAGEAKLHTSA